MHKAIKFLIGDYSPDVNVRAFDKKESPLHVASRRGRGSRSVTPRAGANVPGAMMNAVYYILLRMVDT